MLKLDPIESFDALHHSCKEGLETNVDLNKHYMEDIFPGLDLFGWLDELTLQIPRGAVVSFGKAAISLGASRAAMAIRTISRDLEVRNGHRLVYSDGRVPDENVELLADEIDLTRKKDGWYLKNADDMVSLSIKDPPFTSLAMDQRALASRLLTGNEKIDDLVGIDISSKNGNNICSVCRTDIEGSRIKCSSFRGELGIPYVSGYLFYREGPLILPSIYRAREKGTIDERSLVVLDGNGRLHPRKAGIACQVGAASGMMTAGVAKKLLLGDVGAWRIMDENEELAPVLWKGERIGLASRRNGGSPVYISSGHRTSLDEVASFMISTKRGRIPEPTRWAHEEANRTRRSESPSGDLEVLSLPFHV